MARNEEQPDYQLPSTNWSTIRRAAEQAQSLERVLVRYRPAFLAHLIRKRRLGSAEAEDVLQGFICRKFIESNVLAQAAQHKGRFRNFILTVLDNHLRDFIQEERRHARAAERAERLDASDVPDPFELEWAKGVLEQSLHRMREYYSDKGTTEIWDVFEQRIKQPTLAGRPQPGYAELLETLAFESPEEASNALMTAKRGFRRFLREVIGEYARTPGEVEDELRDLHRILGGSMS